MTPSRPPFVGLKGHAMNLQDILLPGIWPVQGNMSSLWAILLISSFLWIIYRLILVFRKPAGEIEELLGQDIPPVPEIALSGVGPSSVVLYWKLPDNYHTPVKNYVQVNGITVTENDGTSTAVTVPGLAPGRRYTVRAISTNTAGYSSYSQPIHVQAVPEEGQRATRLLSVSEPGLAKRPSTGGRRVSSAPSEGERDATKAAVDVVSRGDNDSDAEDGVSQLTKRLDLLRAENEDLQSQLDEELSDHEKSRVVLAEERDRLKKQHDDRDKAWQESRKHLIDLEKASKAAQRKKSKKESEVQQKKKKRQQMKEEMASWADKQVEMREETEKLRKDRVGIEERHAARLAEARKAIEDAQNHGKSLEDDIRDFGVKIKALEEEKRVADEKEEEEQQEADRLEKEVETTYQVRLQDLEVRYQEVYGANLHVHSRVQQLLQLQAREPHRFAPTPVSDYAYPAYAQPRSARGSISRASTLPYQPQTQTQTTFATAPGSFAPAQNTSPTYSSPFPALGNIDTVTMHSDRDRLGISRSEYHNLTGGAEMSPSADDLLPSNLLSDDPNSTLRPRGRPSILSGAFHSDQRAQDPQSPSSQNSGVHNFFPSPPEVPVGLDDGGRPSNPDIDRALNNLNDAAPRRTGGLFSFNSRRTTKGSSLRESPALGTLRQGQSQSFPHELDEEIASTRSGHQKQISNPWMNMGSLLSRNTGASDDLTLASKPQVPRKSRRLFSSGKFDGNDPFYNLDRTSSPRPASTYSYDQQLLMRPSSESHPFPFSATDHLRLRNSPIGTDWSSLGGGNGGNGTAGAAGGASYSNNHSRRQSIQHGSTSNLSLGSTPLDFDDIQSSSKPATVAPIGAGRPGKQRKQKLNPGAPSFISNVFSRAESKRTPKSDKGTFDSLFDGSGGRAGMGSGSRRGSDIDPATPGLGGYGGFVDDSSPPLSRRSRDGHSVMTSTTDSHDSIGAESDVTGGTGTSASASTSTPKEGFMSRLTRKSSNTKFWGGGSSSSAGGGGGGGGGASTSSISGVGSSGGGGKEKRGHHSHTGSIGGSLGRRRSADMPMTPSEADEDASSDYLGVGVGVGVGAGTPTTEGGRTSSRAGLSWGKMMGKKSKKAESVATSISENSNTGGGGGGEMAESWDGKE